MDEPKRRVLVAEDNANIRKILCLFLQNAGYETLEARNGKEALDEARSGKTDLLLLDVMMPLMDGFEVCRQLKADPATLSLPVIICSARNNREDLVDALRAGASDYIIKPFLRETVLQKVELAFRSRSVSSALTVTNPERRTSRRQAVGWAVSWGLKGIGSGQPVYKSRLLDLSPGGFSFEFARCSPCTGYEIGTVHPLCLFARQAVRFQESEPFDFVLSGPQNLVIEAQGKIAHVYQWTEPPQTEKIGVTFVDLSEIARHAIDQFLAGLR